MSLLTEQEIRDIARSVKDIGENSDRALILAAQKAVIAKIKAQGPVTHHLVPTDVWYSNGISHTKITITPLYELPEGD